MSPFYNTMPEKQSIFISKDPFIRPEWVKKFSRDNFFLVHEQRLSDTSVFITKVVGVTYANPGGVSRQTLIREIYKALSDDLDSFRAYLKHSPSKYDRNAIQVHFESEGGMNYCVGFLPKELAARVIGYVDSLTIGDFAFLKGRGVIGVQLKMSIGKSAMLYGPTKSPYDSEEVVVMRWTSTKEARKALRKNN